MNFKPPYTRRETVVGCGCLLGISFGLGALLSQKMPLNFNWDAISAIAGLLAVFVGATAGTVAWITFNQSKKTHELEFRAWLGFEPHDEQVSTERRLVPKFILKNYGRTPAIKGRVRWRIGKQFVDLEETTEIDLNSDLIEWQDVPEKLANELIAFPGEAHHFNLNLDLEDHDYDFMQAGCRRLFVQARVDYETINGRKGCTIQHMLMGQDFIERNTLNSVNMHNVAS